MSASTEIDGADGADVSRSGVRGLDDVLRGGFPNRRLYLVHGLPGTGKTTLALQFLLEGRRRGERCLYVAVSESSEEIAGVAKSHGWDLSGIDIYDLSRVDHHLGLAEENTLFNPAEVELQEITQPVMDHIAEKQPQRVVFDSLSELRMLAVNTLRYRRRVLALKQLLAKYGCTTLFLDDSSSDPTGDLQLQSLAHGVVELKQRPPLYGRERRDLQIVKMRGVHFDGGRHDFIIERGGVRVYPRLTATDCQARVASREAVKSGLPALDTTLGGGPQRGTSTLIVGPAGSGKSALLSMYAYAAAERGDKVALFLFEEAQSLFLTRARGLGTPLDAHIESGRITLTSVDPADKSPSEFSHLVVAAVKGDGAQIIGIDSLNGYLNAMPDEKFLALQLHELLTVLGMHGVTTFIVMVQHGLIGQTTSPVDVSFIADNVLLLRFFEAGGRIRRAISVMKKRTGPHENTIRELLMARGRIEVGAPLVDFQGVLTGTPIFSGGTAQLLEGTT